MESIEISAIVLSQYFSKKDLRHFDKMCLCVCVCVCVCVCEIETGNWVLKWRPRKHANYSLSCWAGHPGEWTEGSWRGDHSHHQKEGKFFPAQRFFCVCGMKS